MRWTVLVRGILNSDSKVFGDGGNMMNKSILL
jgi:hypothetical protein